DDLRATHTSAGHPARGERDHPGLRRQRVHRRSRGVGARADVHELRGHRRQRRDGGRGHGGAQADPGALRRARSLRRAAERRPVGRAQHGAGALDLAVRRVPRRRRLLGAHAARARDGAVRARPGARARLRGRAAVRRPPLGRAHVHGVRRRLRRRGARRVAARAPRERHDVHHPRPPRGGAGGGRLRRVAAVRGGLRHVAPHGVPGRADGVRARAARLPADARLQPQRERGEDAARAGGRAGAVRPEPRAQPEPARRLGGRGRDGALARGALGGEDEPLRWRPEQRGRGAAGHPPGGRHLEAARRERGAARGARRGGRRVPGVELGARRPRAPRGGPGAPPRRGDAAP
ncbi:MAG: hypothetical protein AVDCRST_MAG40-1353, partial [uncultured Gemmatimonadaceae bacterium]